ncbi:arylsulfatase [Crateriforma conspicua]|uniref:arylsulfatase n=1 Tax=Crateriforma conspicua TaxID=2527996 RepID=UPI00118C2CC5|nr:arylsulfatase [Crateriforma conspicua]QDV66110.1 Arylsulfatase [Crateriforma conspicua]
MLKIHRFAMLMLFVLVTGVASLSAAERPNVVVILADDQGFGDLSWTGNPNFQTPNIDSLARDGARLQHFYVCAVCSPTRAEFLTGRYHTRMGVTSTSSGGERMNTDEVTVADLFRDAGYRTAAYGKWHNGMQAPYHPNSRGFDDFYGFCSGHWGNYHSPMLEHNGRLVDGHGFIVDDLTNHAIDFIRQSGDQPFFVYLPYNTPHSPMQAPDEYWQQYRNRDITSDPDPNNAKQENKDFTRAALAMVANIDDNVGRVLKCLDEQGVADDTIVIYFSDNGPNKARWNVGLRGHKGSVNEGGLRSPCTIRYPAKINAGTEVTQVTGAIDLMPTLMQMAGISEQDRQRFAAKHDGMNAHKIDGVSQVAVLTGDSPQSSDDRLLFSWWKNKASVRSNQYRYHSTGQLFDIQSDPVEDVDLAQQLPQVASELSDALRRATESTVASNTIDPESRPFIIGHPDMALTQLPARDATSTGDIQRSNRFPNCTFFGNWTSTDETIDWDVHVADAGRYRVMIKYACPASSVGTRLKLTAREASVSAVVQKPNDAPLIGADEDLFPRQEGYVKRWADLPVGEIDLQAGPQKLSLHATEIPGDEAIEFRLMMLERVSP